MPKKKAAIKPQTSAKNVVQRVPDSERVFPDVTSKSDLTCRTLLDDQILLIDVGHKPSQNIAYLNSGIRTYFLLSNAKNLSSSSIPCH